MIEPYVPGTADRQLLGREREARIDQPQRRPDVVGERVLQLSIGSCANGSTAVPSGGARMSGAVRITNVVGRRGQVLSTRFQATLEGGPGAGRGTGPPRRRRPGQGVQGRAPGRGQRHRHRVALASAGPRRGLPGLARCRDASRQDEGRRLGLGGTPQGRAGSPTMSSPPGMPPASSSAMPTGPPNPRPDPPSTPPASAPSRPRATCSRGPSNDVAVLAASAARVPVIRG